MRPLSEKIHLICKKHLSKKNNIIILFLFIAFIITRILGKSNALFLSGDSTKYLGLASNFPYHTLYNGSLYLIHPILYPYSIFVFSSLLPDYLAGMLISFIAGIVIFICILRIFQFLKINKEIQLLSLAFFVFSDLSIGLSHAIYKESLFLALFLLSFYYFITWEKYHNIKHLSMSMVLGSLSIITAMQGVFLIPIFIFYMLIFNKKHAKKALLPILILSTIFLIFIVSPRLYIYSTYNYYPAGLEGTIEKVNEYGLSELINPFYFPETYQMMGYNPNIDAFRILRYSIEVVRPEGLITLSEITMIPENIILSVLLFLIIIPIFSMMINYRKINKIELFFLAMLVILLYPAIQSPHFSWARHSYAAIVPLTYFLSRGFIMLLEKLRLSDYICQAIIILSVCFLGVYVAFNPYILYLSEPHFETERSSMYISSLQGDGLMIQPGYVPEIIYLTKKRAIGLPSEPDNLISFIQNYNIEYIVHGQNYPQYSNRTISFVQSNPEIFELIRVIKEEYPNNSEDMIHVYKINSQAINSSGNSQRNPKLSVTPYQNT